MIDLENNKLLALSQAAGFLRRLGGKKIATSSIWRWCRKGARGVRLEHAIIGSRIATSVQALNRFVNALSEAPVAERQYTHQPVPKRRTEKQRERAIAEAKAYLKAHGV